MEELIKIISELISFTDKKVEGVVAIFLKSYSFPENGNFLTQNITFFVKSAIYSLIFVLPLSFLKVVKSENRTILLLFAVSLIILSISAFLTFLGFFQLLFI